MDNGKAEETEDGAVSAPPPAASWFSDALRIFLWTLPAWVPFALQFLLPGVFAAGDGGGRPSTLSVLPVLLVLPGAPAVGFLAAALLCGGSRGAWRAFKRGVAGLSLYFLALALLSSGALGEGGEKSLLYSGLLFWMGFLALLAGGFGSLCRYWWDRFFS